jgi:precorrin-4 methylase
MGSTFVVILIGAGPGRAHLLVVEPMGAQPRVSRPHSGRLAT